MVVLVAAIEVTYVFILSAGTWTTWPTWNTDYDFIAEGFRSGHLYIPVQPPAELLRQANPFDVSNSRMWFLDASLYKGHYYLYWGPVPALLLLACKLVFRSREAVGDQYITFAAYTLFLASGTWLVAQMSRRLFPDVPRGLRLFALVLSILALGYTTPTPYMLASPGIYEAAIAAGQAFLVLGLVFAFDVVWSATDGPPSRWRMLAAGAAWAAAIGSRVTAVLPAAAFVVVTALLATGTVDRWRRAIVNALWLGGPVAAGSLAMGLYNKLRFDSWFEVGLKHQLTFFPMITSRRAIPLNLWSYLLRPLGSSCRFPFVSALYDIGARGFPSARWLPRDYSTHEPQAGLFVTAPFTLLALAAIGFAAWAVVRWRRAGSPATFLDDARARAHVWCVVSFGALALLMPVPFMASMETTIRYMADFSTGMVLLAVWAAWTLLVAVRGTWPRRGVVGLFVALGAVTVIVGALLGFQGYDDMFRNHNARLYEILWNRLSFCG